ncbi:MAG: PAS domain-containing protein [Nitrospirae bacterium]|nr:PAS domain-containing protein [Candidatus Manganitrophaceae bacterium]
MTSPKTRYHQIRLFALLFLGFSSLFLILLAIYSFLQFQALGQALDLSNRERLKLLAESVRSAVTSQLDKVKTDPSFLATLSKQKSLTRIVLVDSDGTIFADSQPETLLKEEIDAAGPRSAWQTALEGKMVVETSTEPRSGEAFGRIWMPLGGRAGDPRRAIQLIVPLTSRGDSRVHSLFLFMKFFGITGAGILGYYLIRLFFVPSPFAFQGAGEGAVNETGFVMSTFQNLIQQLKQKEQELERLKGRAEEHAESVESYNENILQSVTSGVLTFNCDRIVTTFNATAGAILYLSPDAVMGKSYETIFGKDQKIARILEETLRGTAVAREECEVDRSDGKKIWLGMNTSVLRDRSNRTIGATLVFTDLTEMKALQDQVELKKRLSVMGEMSAWIAHEFRNYMGTILGFSRLLSKKIEPNDPRQEMIKAITTELSAMERLITELLDYGRKTVIHPLRTPIGSILEELREQFEGAGAYPNIRWNLLFKDPSEIDVDPILIRQAFLNLIQNALEAMEGEGEISITAATRSPGIMEIKIKDIGVGISKENLDKIFLPFFTTKEKGTGLGLALVHKIVLAHGGQISVESVEGFGTTFTVRLPRQIPLDIGAQM